MPTAELVVSVAEKSVGGTSAADTIVTAWETKQERFELVNSAGQVVASVIGLFKILAPISLQANTFAGTVTFLKIVVDWKDPNKDVSVGDVWNLVGNISGAAATVTMLAGGPPVWVAVLTGTAIVAGAAGIYSGENFSKLTSWSSEVMDNFWPDAPVPETTSDLYMDTEGEYRTYDEIASDPESGFGAILVEHSSWGNPESIVEIEQPPRDDDEIEMPNEM